MTEISFVVDDALPPAKDESKSVLSAGHSQPRRVRRLLEAAGRTMSGHHLLAGSLGLELTVYAPASDTLPDAANMLAGICDVLQARTSGADVTHLGPLATVACYHDDSQIIAIHYGRIDANATSYRVRLWTLS